MRHEKAQPDLAFARRLKEAFNGVQDAEIARKLGYRSQSPVNKFMKGIYPKAEVLIEISRVTKRSIDWLLTGQGESDLDPYRFLEGNARAIIQKLADVEGKPLEEMLNLLVREALAGRGAALFARYPEMEIEDLEEMRALLTLFEGDLGDSATSSAQAATSRQRDAG